MTSKTEKRIYGIDSLRAFAALSVLLVHLIGSRLPELFRTLPLGLGDAANYSKYIFTGHPAVIVFFVISGFCIHYPYAQRSSSLYVISFWAARWLRLMPPAFVAIFCAWKLGIKQYNFVDGYILWSVLCELIYYMLYPFLLVISKFVSWQNLFFVSFVFSTALAMLLGSDQYGNANSYGPYLNWFIALPSWLIGCVLAEQVRNEERMPICRPVWMWRIFIASCASFLYYLTINTGIGYYLTMNVFGIMVYFWIKQEIVSATKKKSTVFENIGKWSYSIYLFHVVAATFFDGIYDGKIGLLLDFVQIPFVLLFCYFAYVFIEKPSHKVSRYVGKLLRNTKCFILNKDAIQLEKA